MYNNERKRALVTNDDGIYADGIKLLCEVVREMGFDVYVFAPSSEQSARSHAVSTSSKIAAYEISHQCYAISGTPADCVICALNSGVLKDDEMPHIVISGINNGANIGCDIQYSGTVGAACEGALHGIPSIALSQAYKEVRSKTDWSVSKRYCGNIIDILCSDMIFTGQKEYGKTDIFNVNFPSNPNVRGIRVAEMGELDAPPPRDKLINVGHNRFLLKESSMMMGSHDIHYLGDSYITVTPLSTNMTDFAKMKNTAAAFKKMEEF